MISENPENPEISSAETTPYVRLRKTRAERKAEASAHVEEIIAGLIAKGTYNIAIGQSGIGKSPFFVMMALCVAFGIPFLGLPVQRGRVLFVDYENGDGLTEMEDTLSEFLGIQADDAEWDEWYSVTYYISHKDLEKEIA